MNAYFWLGYILGVLIVVWFALRLSARGDAASQLPENHDEIVRRINEREALAAIARRRVEELNTTTSPLHR